MTKKVKSAVLLLAIIVGAFWLISRANFGASASPAHLTLSAPFERKILRMEENFMSRCLDAKATQTGESP
jgi:hypothetical protein